MSAAVAVLGVLGLVVPRRQVRAELTSLGIILASFGGVELSGGQVHAHLYILTAIALVALYQRWLPRSTRSAPSSCTTPSSVWSLPSAFSPRATHSAWPLR